MQVDLLEYFAKELFELIHGIGPKSIEEVMKSAKSFEGLLDLEKGKLGDLKTEGGKTIFNSGRLKAFLNLRVFFSADNGLRENCIKLLTLKFIDRNVSSVLDKDTLKELNINPFIIREFDLTEPREVIELYLYQNVTRGIVTSMGDQFEKLAKVVALDDTEQRGFDGELNRSGTRYFIQVKSGPDVLNKDMLERLEEHIDKAEEDHPSCKPLLGLGYGTEKQVSDKIENYLPGGLERVKIGEGFWDFIAGQEGYYTTILKTVSESAKQYPRFAGILSKMGNTANSDYQKEANHSSNPSLTKAIKGQSSVLEENWKERYGTLRGSTVDKMVEDLMGS